MEIIRDKILLLPIESESDVGFCRRKSVALAKELDSMTSKQEKLQ